MENHKLFLEHILIVPLILFDIVTYDGWKSHSDTQSVCPSPVMMISPPGTAHIFHVLSSLLVASICFLGCKAKLK